MTDRYERIREALAMRPTPGPWFCHDRLGHAVATAAKARIAADSQPAADPGADVRYIAACHPEAIRALLAERDAMKAALQEALAWHESQDKAISKKPNANTGSNGWMRCEHQEQAEIIRAALAQEQGEHHDIQD